MFDPIEKFPKKRIFRVVIVFIIAFVAINIFIDKALPSYGSTLRASEKLLKDNVCNFVHKDFRDIRLSLAVDEKPKIFLLGDSISYGIGVENEQESISGFLRDFSDEYSVYNLSSCGSKPLDYHLWISYLLENHSDGGNIFVIQYNYKWFNLVSHNLEDKVSQKRTLLHFDKYLDDEILTTLGHVPGFFERLKYNIDAVLPASSNRIKLFAALFNEKSKENIIENIFFKPSEKDTFKYKIRYWREKDEMKSFNCMISYAGTKWDAETNFNYNIYSKTLNLLGKNNQKAFVFMPPYNYELTRRCRTEAFYKNIDEFLEKAQESNVSSASLIDLVDEEHFLDDMHLNSQGNENVASKISQYINIF